MLRYLMAIAAATIGLWASAPDEARASPPTVDCESKHNQYRECPARFGAPVLVMQKSQSPCILNTTWGYNPATGYIWVSAGCRGIFAQQHGYHHGQSGGMDVDARRYSNQGGFIGYGPLIAVQKNVTNNRVTINSYSETNIVEHHHDIRRIVEPDATDEIDATPQFDRNGNPNFDTEGNYIGPHGLGALVDAPEDGIDTGSDDSGG
jgi:hypothetical protein